MLHPFVVVKVVIFFALISVLILDTLRSDNSDELGSRSSTFFNFSFMGLISLKYDEGWIYVSVFYFFKQVTEVLHIFFEVISSTKEALDSLLSSLIFISEGLESVNFRAFIDSVPEYDMLWVILLYYLIIFMYFEQIA